MTASRGRIPSYHRSIGSATPGVLFCDPDQDFPERWAGRGRWQPGEPMHTFVDDYRQEFFWRRPQEGLMVALSAGIVTAPDYTCYTDDPAEYRSYQAWRSATIAAYWQRAGVVVVPVVSFFTGISRYVRGGSAWAVRGSRCERWRQHLEAFVGESCCALLLVFGREVVGLSCETRNYALRPSRNGLHKRRA